MLVGHLGRSNPLVESLLEFFDRSGVVAVGGNHAD
jgi:hypothetical protein